MSGFRTHLAAIRCELLSLGHTGIDHDFFELGGDSPMAARLFARIEQSFGPKVPACGAVPARHDSVSHVARGGNRSTVRRRPATERRRPKLVADAVDWRALLYSEGLMKELDARFPIVGIQPAVDVRNMEQFRDFSTAADCFVNTRRNTSHIGLMPLADSPTEDWWRMSLLTCSLKWERSVDLLAVIDTVPGYHGLKRRSGSRRKKLV